MHTAAVPPCRVRVAARLFHTVLNVAVVLLMLETQAALAKQAAAPQSVSTPLALELEAPEARAKAFLALNRADYATRAQFLCQVMASESLLTAATEDFSTVARALSAMSAADSDAMFRQCVLPALTTDRHNSSDSKIVFGTRLMLTWGIVVHGWGLASRVPSIFVDDAVTYRRSRQLATELAATGCIHCDGKSKVSIDYLLSLAPTDESYSYNWRLWTRTLSDVLGADRIASESASAFEHNVLRPLMAAILSPSLYLNKNRAVSGRVWQESEEDTNIWFAGQRACMLSALAQAISQPGITVSQNFAETLATHLVSNTRAAIGPEALEWVADGLTSIAARLRRARTLTLSAALLRQLREGAQYEPKFQNDWVFDIQYRFNWGEGLAAIARCIAAFRGRHHATLDAAGRLLLTYMRKHQGPWKEKHFGLLIGAIGRLGPEVGYRTRHAAAALVLQTMENVFRDDRDEDDKQMRLDYLGDLLQGFAIIKPYIGAEYGIRGVTLVRRGIHLIETDEQVMEPSDAADFTRLVVILEALEGRAAESEVAAAAHRLSRILARLSASPETPPSTLTEMGRALRDIPGRYLAQDLAPTVRRVLANADAPCAIVLRFQEPLRQQLLLEAIGNPLCGVTDWLALVNEFDSALLRGARFASPALFSNGDEQVYFQRLTRALDAGRRQQSIGRDR